MSSVYSNDLSTTFPWRIQCFTSLFYMDCENIETTATLSSLAIHCLAVGFSHQIGITPCWTEYVPEVKKLRCFNKLHFGSNINSLTRQNHMYMFKKWLTDNCIICRFLEKTGSPSQKKTSLFFFSCLQGREYIFGFVVLSCLSQFVDCTWRYTCIVGMFSLLFYKSVITV